MDGVQAVEQRQVEGGRTVGGVSEGDELRVVASEQRAEGLLRTLLQVNDLPKEQKHSAFNPPI